jgi:hypothetical protein
LQGSKLELQKVAVQKLKLWRGPPASKPLSPKEFLRPLEPIRMQSLSRRRE